MDLSDKMLERARRRVQELGIEVDLCLMDAQRLALPEDVFDAAVPCRKSGLHGYTVRVLPHHPDLATPVLPGLIVWAGPGAKAR